MSLVLEVMQQGHMTKKCLASGLNPGDNLTLEREVLATILLYINGEKEKKTKSVHTERHKASHRRECTQW